MFITNRIHLTFQRQTWEQRMVIYGGEIEEIAVENRLKFYVDWLKGQKQASL